MKGLIDEDQFERFLKKHHPRMPEPVRNTNHKSIGWLEFAWPEQRVGLHIIRWMDDGMYRDMNRRALVDRLNSYLEHDWAVIEVWKAISQINHMYYGHLLEKLIKERS